jgi:alpha-tubulin suppressor-like RCC1 family protein
MITTKGKFMQTRGNLIRIFLACAAVLQMATSGAQGVTAIAAGYRHSLLLKSDGSLWATGWNNHGQLGDGTTTDKHVPTLILASNVTAIAAGPQSASSLFLTSDGSLWGMGLNNYGQLGNGTPVDSHSPYLITNNVKAIAAGYGHNLFLKSDGTLWGMGLNSHGQLGDGTTSNRLFPEMITNNVTAIAAGGYHSLFIKGDGSLWGVGRNDYGQLGNGTYYTTNRPVQIVLSNVMATAGGNYFTLFLKSDGSMWGMGFNYFGELGLGTYSRNPPYGPDIPVMIVSSGATSIAAGYAHSLFLRNDGSLWAMGSNPYGQLGDGTTTDVNLPEQIIGGMPAMGISNYNNQPLVFFPSVGTNYMVQMNANLATTNWVTVTNGIPVSGLTTTNGLPANGLVITNAPSPAFFRLH